MAQPTKQDHIDALTAAGVPLTGDEKIADLKDLAATNNVTVGAPEAPSDVSEVTVNWNTGSRVYSKEIHGDAFLDLANEFCVTHASEGAVIAA